MTFIDKRKVTRDRTTENRGRFLRRIKGTIQDQLPDIIKGKSLKDMDKSGGKIKVNRKTIQEPTIHHTDGGNIDRVLPGNKEYVPGDEIMKPKSGGGGGRGKQASDGPDGEDDFVIELTREEFMDAFFEGLELPDMLKTELAKVVEYKRENAGFQPDGSPNRLNVIRSYKQSFVRRLSLTSALKTKLAELEDQLFNAKFEVEHAADSEAEEKFKAEVFLIEQQITETTARLEKQLPMFEDMDLRYRSSIKREIPVTHATMIMIMDNSGSMGEKEKTIARKFFWLLYSFLRRTYEKVDMRFISHTTDAEEMSEDDFFNTHVSGGTIVSSALTLASEIIYKELLNKTNIYIAQVSDGDNMDYDNADCTKILTNEILPAVRYMAYMQVDQDFGDSPSPSSLMRGLYKAYHDAAAQNPKLATARVHEERDIFPVFRDLFKKK